METVVDTIQTKRVIAIVRLEQYDCAVEIAQALKEGGVTIVEFTLTGQGAFAAVDAVRATFGDTMQVGLGTVLHTYEVREALAAGVQFVVTPVVLPEVIAVCQVMGMPLVCGAFTPTEIFQAHNAGATMVKLFPASAVGPMYVRNVLGPLPQVQLVPTGGIDPSTVRGYLDAGAVAVGLSNNLVSPKAVDQGDWVSITTQARACVAAVESLAVRVND